jgi:methionyl-tRNA formyltransferase
MRVVFMGNPEIAKQTLTALHESKHEVISVVSNSPKSMGRGRTLNYSPIGKLAQELKLDFIPAESVEDQDFHFKLKSLSPDLFVVVAYKILPRDLLKIPKIGAVNLHASLLPKYRGAAPIQHALLNGDEETGITTFFIEPNVDTGAILLQEKIIVNHEDDFGSLSKRIMVQGAALMLRTLDKIEDGTVQAINQNNDLASLAPKIRKEMYKIDWSQTAQKIHNQIRAFSPSPGAFTTLNEKRLKIFKSKVLMGKQSIGSGKISLLEKNRMAISCGEGELEIFEIQLADKRRMSMAACLQGVQFNLGDPIGE